MRYTSGSLETFATDEMAVDAATKCIEVIGEASKHILEAAPELQQRYPGIKLNAAYLTRNRLSHGYFDVDPRRVWDTARHAVPELVESAKRVLNEHFPEEKDDR